VNGELNRGRGHAELEHGRGVRVDQERQGEQVGVPAVGEPHPELAQGLAGRLTEEPAWQLDAAELDAFRDAWHARAVGRQPDAFVRRRQVGRGGAEEHLSVLAEAREGGRGPDDLLALLRQDRLTERRSSPAAYQ
jgi:hypothetical protein